MSIAKVALTVTNGEILGTVILAIQALDCQNPEAARFVLQGLETRMLNEAIIEAYEQSKEPTPCN